jgi:hypothetical protein
MNVINPAYAGVDNQTQISGSIRSMDRALKILHKRKAVSLELLGKI